MTTEKEGMPRKQPIDSAAEPVLEPPQYDAMEILRGGRLAIIRHEGAAYRLLLTRNQRLILQK